LIRDPTAFSPACTADGRDPLALSTIYSRKAYSNVYAIEYFVQLSERQRERYPPHQLNFQTHTRIAVSRKSKATFHGTTTTLTWAKARKRWFSDAGRTRNRRKAAPHTLDH
ncbi:hypothetical protein BC937DRAFT_94095, partial [Endogone sp. FLAS-F59071]